jgi:predicted MPP superfamily phosphohydrolase
LQKKSQKSSEKFIEQLWDAWCIASIVGIWPRFIEPYLLRVKRLSIPISLLPSELEGMKVLQFSDLHFSAKSQEHFLHKVSDQIQKEAADLIVFTGDLISYSQMYEKEKLVGFLQSLQAPFGAFAVLGNHDYREYVTVASDRKTRKVTQTLPTLLRGFARLFSVEDTSCQAPEVTDPIDELPTVCNVYEEAGFCLLNNATVQVGTRFAKINLTGVGCDMAKQCHPEEAFQKYQPNTAGIVLSHSPDSFPLLQQYPGDLLLFGHTHGGLVNLPYIWKKVTYLKNERLKQGLFRIKNKFLYVNRGIGSPFPFRWFAPPEITVFTLVRGGPLQETAWEHLFVEEKAQGVACTPS